MHGLVIRAIQFFLQDTYGAALWAEVAGAAGHAPDGFEAMLRYPPETPERLLAAAAARLDRPAECILEDIGTYLVSHPNMAALRRMLRFGGRTFEDFLHSLEELPGRARLAVPDLDLPVLELDGAGEALVLTCRGGGFAGMNHVMLGLLRALADDYGALAVIDPAGDAGGGALSIRLLDRSHGEARRFHLAAAG